MKNRTYTHLSQEERMQLYSMREKCYSIRKISKILRRSPSTISRELKRNRLPLYVSSSPIERANYADTEYKKRKSNSRRGLSKWNNPLLIDFVLSHYQENHWSPMQISNYLKTNHPSLRISATSIYEFIKSNSKAGAQNLARKGKAYRSNISGKKRNYYKGPKTKRNISERPNQIETREEFGHWEIDTIHGKKSGSKGAILTLFERKFRVVKYFKLKDLTADETRKTLIKFIHGEGKGLVHSITADNGAENAEWNEVEKVCPGVKFYFCDPYKSWQKGAVEKANEELRRFYPKGTDWSDVSEEELKWCEKIINGKPKKCLDWAIPTEEYSKMLCAA